MSRIKKAKSDPRHEKCTGVLVSGAQEEELYRAQSGRCFYCRRVMSPRPYHDILDGTNGITRRKQRAGGWTSDHFFPRMLGYGLQANKVLACTYCNRKKGCSEPTSEEVGRAILTYAACGKAFLPTIDKKSAAYQRNHHLMRYIKFFR